MRPFLAATTLSLLLTACVTDRIQVTVTPRRDGAIDRTLRIWRENTGSDGKQVIEPSEYGLPADAARRYERTDDGAVAVFHGRFETVPGDLVDGEVANRGSFVAWSAGPGTAWVYKEIFPGRTDFHGQALERETLVEAVVAVVADAFAKALEGEEGLESLLTAIRGPLEQDLQDMAALADGLLRTETWSKTPGGIGEGLALVLVQVAEDRGYLAPGDYEWIVGEDAEEGAVRRIQAWVARAMGRELDEGLTRRLAFLDDDASREAAWERSLPASGWTKEQFEERLERVLGFALFGSGVQVEFRLESPAPPIATNGTRREGSSGLVWNFALRAEAPMPPFVYAAWAEPDETWQSARFGRVALTGRPLFDYVLWERGLDPAQRARWREGLDALDPAADLRGQILALDGATTEEAAGKGARLLLGALDG